MSTPDERVSKNFLAKEYMCRCGCGTWHIEPLLIEMVQELRDAYSEPIHLTSAIRCHTYNRLVGGKPQSYHRTTAKTPCRAVDISCPVGSARYVLLDAAFKVGFSGIGIADSFLHFDIREGPKYLWTYSVKG